MQDLLLGTSGYDYPEWKGVFYPADLKRCDFLIFYATQFNALEVNNTFYNMPTAERLFSFYERSEGKLQFSIKANRLLTHEISGGWQVVADDFKAALKPLREKDRLCAVLFQFPQSFHYTDENRIYLARLISEFEGFPVVIEFRHLEWIRESVFAGLEERGASLVFCDMPMRHLAQTSITSNYANGAERRMPRLNNLPAGDFSGGETRLAPSPFIGKTAYIRLHGRNAEAWYCHEEREGEKNGSGRYRYDYSDAELCEFVPIVQSALMEGKRTAVFFNNHPDGSGAKNARRLKEMILEGRLMLH
ncbi:MAG: DUF72 domain-containing protein [Treponema sp.]|uniref:DUF72 domain-containing protein n=1 Tax=Treponema sp. TaxID=166 RepID=UPI0025CF2EDA|nr:DUF72 domain-containing protein [Treponema sp.]MBQ9283176.1 DUF72 domain-containing protein [Treponema sp.]